MALSQLTDSVSTTWSGDLRNLPALFLLHGFANEAHIWDLFAPVVAGRYHVYAFDARGHGDTEYANEYGGSTNVEDVLALAAALNVAKFAVVGFSMGGMSAMTLIPDHPGVIVRLVLVDVGPEMNIEGTSRVREIVGGAPSVFNTREEVLAYIRMANPRRVDELVESSFRHAFRPLPQGGFELKYDPKLRHNFGGRRMPTRDDLWESIKRITCPTLIIRGAGSRQFHATTALRMVETMPDVRLVTVPHAGHSVMLDNPAAFNEVVDSFL